MSLKDANAILRTTIFYRFDNLSENTNSLEDKHYHSSLKKKWVTLIVPYLLWDWIYCSPSDKEASRPRGLHWSVQTKKQYQFYMDCSRTERERNTSHLFYEASITIVAKTWQEKKTGKNRKETTLPHGYRHRSPQ